MKTTTLSWVVFICAFYTVHGAASDLQGDFNAVPGQAPANKQWTYNQIPTPSAPPYQPTASIISSSLAPLLVATTDPEGDPEFPGTGVSGYLPYLLQQAGTTNAYGFTLTQGQLFGAADQNKALVIVWTCQAAGPHSVSVSLTAAQPSTNGFQYAVYQVPNGGTGTALTTGPYVAVAGPSGTSTFTNNGNPVTVAVGDAIWLILASGSTFGANGAQMTMTVTNDNVGSGGGDPQFVSFRGEQFLFPGQAGLIYNIFSDAHLSISSLFDYANPSAKTGTIMRAIGLTFANRSLTFDTESRLAPGQYSVKLDGSTTVVQNGLQLSPCVMTTPQWASLSFTSPLHQFTVVWDSDNSSHVNTTFLDFSFRDMDSRGAICGLLGEATMLGAKNLIESRFVANSLTSGNAKADCYGNKPFKC